MLLPVATSGLRREGGGAKQKAQAAGPASRISALRCWLLLSSTSIKGGGEGGVKRAI